MFFINLLIGLIVFIIGLLVANDCREKKIANSLGWGVGTMLLLIIVLPLYLIRRPALIKKAQDNPVEANTPVVFGVLTIFFIIILLIESSL